VMTGGSKTMPVFRALGIICILLCFMHLYAIRMYDLVSLGRSNQKLTSSGHRHMYMFPHNITSLQQLHDIDVGTTPVPSDLSIVFVGDSVTRYQYISLAFFLKFGNWIYHNSTVNLNEITQSAPAMGMIWKHSESTLHEWFNYSNSILSPYEQCDCIDPPQGNYREFGVKSLENRYFWHPSANNSVVYLQKFGYKNNWNKPLTFKSTGNVSAINECRKRGASAVGYRRGGDVVYRSEDWISFIRDFVSELRPRPQFFIFNQGLWNHDDFLNQSFQKEVVDTISDVGMISVYKTTTRWKTAGSEGAIMDIYEREICDIVDLCFDLSWTWLVPGFLFADRAHFLEPVYTWFNIQLLGLLQGYMYNEPD